MSIHFSVNLVEKSLNKKIRLSVIFILLIFCFILIRLWYLQILRGNKYIELSINNRIRVTKTTAPRGIILSKNNEIFIKNTPSFDLKIIPQDTQDIDKVLKDISYLLKIDLKQLKRKVEKKKGNPPFEPITLKKELSWNEMSLVLSKKMNLQGLSINVVPKRLYCLGNFAPHVFGFLGEVNREELNNYKELDYDPGDLIGKYGLEKWGERYLRGKKGGLQTEVDVYGNRKKILAEIEPISGKNIVISINPELQKTTEFLMEDKKGAVVAMNPYNGEILAMVSTPGFDSNLFSRGIDYKDWKNLIDNPFHPLLNKSIQCQQPPGSVFKVLTVIAALEEKVVDPNQKFFCPGFFKLGNRRFHCWKNGGHGWMDMKAAVVESCDCYFYNIALRLDVDTIASYARIFGLGEKTGVDLEGEKKGLIPTSEWKKKKYGIPWQKGETLNIAIGQGFLLTTPIQLATVFSGLATGTAIPKPRIVLKIDNQKFDSFSKPFSVSNKTISFIKAALTGVVNDSKGTGKNAKIKGVLVAGKTGTAQVISKKINDERQEIPWKHRDHAWFVAFAPAEKPVIVVSVFVEHGGSGGKVAAPIAKEIIKTYLKII